MPGGDGLGFWVIFKKNSLLRFEAGRSELIFGPGRGQSSCVLRDAPAFVGSGGTFSIVEIVSLSLLVLKT